jgi:hypothetical protein
MLLTSVTDKTIVGVKGRQPRQAGPLLSAKLSTTATLGSADGYRVQ